MEDVKGDLERSTGVTNPLTLLQAMIDKGVDPDALQKMMELSERWEHNQSQKAFAVAISGFQAECPMVFKGREVKNKSGGTMYHFATYEDIKRVTKPLEAKWGISTSFDIKHTEGPSTINGQPARADTVLGTCRVRVGNYFEDRTFAIPVPKGLNTNQSQDYGAALTYLRRYLYCAALDIVITGEDTDATNVFETLIQSEVDQLASLIEEKGVDLARFLEWAQVDALPKMPRSEFAKAMSLLKQKKAGGK